LPDEEPEVAKLVEAKDEEGRRILGSLGTSGHCFECLINLFVYFYKNQRFTSAEQQAPAPTEDTITALPVLARGRVGPNSKWRLLRRKSRMCFLRSQYPWVQLAGHDGGFKVDVDPHWILKQSNPYEKVWTIELEFLSVFSHNTLIPSLLIFHGK
jgi:hypothetical protein